MQALLLLLSISRPFACRGSAAVSTTTSSRKGLGTDQSAHACSHVAAWIDILSPKSAQLFVEGMFDEIRLQYAVHGVDVGEGKAHVMVYIIK